MLENFTMFQALFQGICFATRQTSGKSARNHENKTEIRKQQGAAFGDAPRGRALRARPVGVVALIILDMFRHFSSYRGPPPVVLTGTPNLAGKIH